MSSNHDKETISICRYEEIDDSYPFHIDRISGEIFVYSPDQEYPLDFERREQYIFNVFATDGQSKVHFRN